jgi:hypothetical protein
MRTARELGTKTGSLRSQKDYTVRRAFGEARRSSSFQQCQVCVGGISGLSRTDQSSSRIKDLNIESLTPINDVAYMGVFRVPYGGP